MFFALLTAWLSGCGDPPCLDLSKTICRCEPTEAEQRSCIQRVEDEAAVRETTEAQEDRCVDLLGTCDCEKLADGDLAACGLNND